MNGWHRKADDAAARARAAKYRSVEHKRQRAAGQALVDAGVAYCWRCRGWIAPGSRWHVGHDDDDPTMYRGPEHASCNLKAAARKGSRVANARRKAEQQRQGVRQWPSVWNW